MLGSVWHPLTCATAGRSSVWLPTELELCWSQLAPPPGNIPFDFAARQEAGSVD